MEDNKEIRPSVYHAPVLPSTQVDRVKELEDRLHTRVEATETRINKLEKHWLHIIESWLKKLWRWD